MDSSKIIDSFGGTGKLAKKLGLDKSSVSVWRKRGIPRAWVLYLKTVNPRIFRTARK
jgi:DNA-binding transcriptional regulator Cro